MKMKKFLVGILAASMLLAVGCGSEKTGKETKKTTLAEETVTAETQASKAEDSEEELLTGLHHVVITVKDYGTIEVELDADHAPISTTNFIKLAESKFYDGLTFHRIISGFMIQGGDPTGTGMGGSDESIKGEFASNGVDNPLRHTRGAISMARTQAPNSASSQFFIVHEDSDFLDGEYAVFGYVTSGMEVVDQICADTTVEDNNGTVAPANQPVIESIVVVD